jgi:hypothetical protein
MDFNAPIVMILAAGLLVCGVWLIVFRYVFQP